MGGKETREKATPAFGGWSLFRILGHSGVAHNKSFFLPVVLVGKITQQLCHIQSALIVSPCSIRSRSKVLDS